MKISHKYKQVVIIRTDLKMKTGKKVAQACHASIIAYDIAVKTKPTIAKAWRNEGQKKIALKVGSQEELLQIYNHAKALHLPTSLVADAGLTQLEPGTQTAVGIGPASTVEIDKITNQLKLL